ncbi:MAG: DUF2804 domain-containing protein [Raoultibacter sp.]
MEQNRITEKGPLHASDGSLANPGYATSLLLDYKRSAVAASKWRLKEWDYYLINDEEYALCLTLGDLGYAGLISASIVDFVKNEFQTTSTIVPLPLGGFKMPESSEQGISEFENSRVHFRFEVKDGIRKIRARFNRFKGNEDLVVDAVLDEEPQDSMVIATPWKEDPKAFYYNQKILGMRAQGSFRLGMLLHGFRPHDSFALLDWGRGVWTYDNLWFWAAAHGWQDEKGKRSEPCRFALNLGYGFGDTSAATENMAFVDGKMYKFGIVDFGIPKLDLDATEKGKGVAGIYDLMKPWSVKDQESKVDLVFTPQVDRFDYINMGVIVSDQHQVFGTFSGKVMLDDEEFIVSELNGSAEVVHNKY